MNSFSCCHFFGRATVYPSLLEIPETACVPVSHIFDRMGNNDIGLLLAGSSELPSLGTGITSAIFYALGKAAI